MQFAAFDAWGPTIQIPHRDVCHEQTVQVRALCFFWGGGLI